MGSCALRLGCLAGPARRSKQQRQEVLRMTAFHEAGHTLVALLTNNAQLLHKVTILPRGQSGGAVRVLDEQRLDFRLSVVLTLGVSTVPCLQTFFLPDHKDEGYETKAQILAQIDVSMGGRVAEEMLLGADNVTTGAGMDMAQATELARRFCMVYSMSELGLSSFAQSEPAPATRTLIEKEVEKILEESYARVVALLKANSPKLTALAETLLLHEVCLCCFI